MRPGRVESELLALLLRIGDGHKVAAWAAAFGNLIRDAVVVELEMPAGHLEGGVENRVLDDDRFHGTAIS
jgi:hypothetical protein